MWWCGQTEAKLEQKIYQLKGFMNEAHVHGFANRLNQTIITIDERESHLVLLEYVPGYEVQHQLSMREAKKRRVCGQ